MEFRLVNSVNEDEFINKLRDISNEIIIQDIQYSIASLVASGASSGVLYSALIRGKRNENDV